MGKAPEGMPRSRSPAATTRSPLHIRSVESSCGTRIVADRNLALPGSKADFSPEYADTFHRDILTELRVNYLLTNSPYNDFQTSQRGSATPQNEAKPQVVSEDKENVRKDVEVCRQFGGPLEGDESMPQHHLN